MSFENPYEAGQARPKPGQNPGRRVTVRRIDVLSLGKIQAAVMCVFGLIGGFFLLVAMFLGLVGGVLSGDGDAAVGSVVMVFGGLFFLILATLFYAAIGFVAGCLAALVYNAAAGMFGGLELELDGSATEFG